MNIDDIKPRTLVKVPKGADMTRVRPYQLRITQVRSRSEDIGHVHVQGELFRLDGSPVQRTGFGRRGPVTIAAILDPARLQEAAHAATGAPDRGRRVPPASREAAELPRRVARVAHALLARTKDQYHGGLVTTTEVCEYDSPVDAPTVAHTRKALNRAMRYGLADRAGWNLWMPTRRAHDLRRALEDIARAQEAEEDHEQQPAPR